MGVLFEGPHREGRNDNANLPHVLDGLAQVIVNVAHFFLVVGGVEVFEAL